MIKISLDCDGTLFDFWSAYDKKFKNTPNYLDNYRITRNVRKLMNNKEFWENLELLERPNFEPCNYCTRRINSKVYTRNCMIKHDLPVKPIYQVLTQRRNKAEIIKGRCDVLIDDSEFNVRQCISAGVPALLIDRPTNQNNNMFCRIFSLDYAEIEDAYDFLKFQLRYDYYAKQEI